MAEVDYDTFVKLHESQFRASGVPEHLYAALSKKLSRQIFDAGKFSKNPNKLREILNFFQVNIFNFCYSTTETK